MGDVSEMSPFLTQKNSNSNKFTEIQCYVFDFAARSSHLGVGAL